MGKRWTNEMNSEFKADWMSGMHYKEVAVKYGVSPTNVYSKARRLGLQTRRAAKPSVSDDEDKRYRDEAIAAITSVTLFVGWIAFMLTMWALQN